jgi:hypothetical protein
MERLVECQLLYIIVKIITLVCRQSDIKGELLKMEGVMGTRKSALIMTSDGKREKWEISSPRFLPVGRSITSRVPRLTRTGSMPRNQRLVRAGDAVFGRWREDLAGGGEKTPASPARTRNKTAVKTYGFMRGWYVPPGKPGVSGHQYHAPRRFPC